MRRTHYNLLVAISQLFGSIVGIVVTLMFASTPIKDFDGLIKIVLSLFITLFVVDRFGEIFKAHQKDADAADAAIGKKLFDRAKSFTIFDSAQEAIKHCIYALGNNPTKVFNTVLRYGARRGDRDRYLPAYAKWLLAKKKSCIEDKCQWFEIVSSHLLPSDDQRILMHELASIDHYHSSEIDDVAISLIQMTIFEYGKSSKRPREMVFGWEFPNYGASESVFLTTDHDLIEFFLAYFLKWHENDVPTVDVLHR